MAENAGSHNKRANKGRHVKKRQPTWPNMMGEHDCLSRRPVCLGLKPECYIHESVWHIFIVSTCLFKSLNSMTLMCWLTAFNSNGSKCYSTEMKEEKQHKQSYSWSCKSCSWNNPLLYGPLQETWWRSTSWECHFHRWWYHTLQSHCQASTARICT